MTIRPSLKATIVAGAALGALASAAYAADIIEPAIIEAPVIEQVKPFGGWYIRGDVGYAKLDERDGVQIDTTFGQPKQAGNQPATVIPFTTEAEDNAFTVGVGVGGHLGQYLRADITADYLSGGKLTFGQDLGCAGTACNDVYEAEFNAILMMANAYVDAGTYAGITPYVGAGIGFARIAYDDVLVTCTTPCGPAGGTTVNYDSDRSLRLAWSLAAGASYDVNDQFAIDAGYRFTRVEEGKIADIEGTEFKDSGVDLHQVRLGARVKLH